jgi:hypothetical protein
VRWCQFGIKLLRPRLLSSEKPCKSGFADPAHPMSKLAEA